MNANKQDAGWLPDLPEPEGWTFDGGECIPCNYTADQMRAYGELCRAEALQRVSENAANMLAMPIEPGTLELCRAAPAGGDWPDIKPDGFSAREIASCMDVDQLRSWAHCMRRERDNWRQRALDAEMELVGDNGLDPPDSAPAGSGEVLDSWQKWPIINRLQMQANDCEDAADMASDAVVMPLQLKALAADLREAAALLRKLQQGADGVDWRAQYRFQTAMRYMDNNDKMTLDRAQRMADEDIVRMERAAMIAASQDQDGGKA